MPSVPLAQAVVDCAVYVDGVRLPGTLTPGAALKRVRELGRGFVWIGLREPDHHQMQAVAEVFGLHELAVEDAVHAYQRPKLERYDDTLFLVLKTLSHVDAESIARAREIVETGEIMIFVGPEFVVTVRHGEHSGLAMLRKRLDASPAHLSLGPYAVLHAITDQVVDSYLAVADLVETDVDLAQEDVFSPTLQANVEHIYLLKREVVEMRRSVAPLTLELKRMATEHDDLISIEVRHYIADILDHTIQAADRIAGYDEMLASLIDAAVGKVTTQQNVDLRKISSWAAILSVPTMVAGIYGMRFAHIPELAWSWSYPALMAAMAGACVFFYRNLRRNRWL